MRKILPIICICLSLTACFENKEDKPLINEKIAQFLDINKIANATSRMNLVLPLSKMQEIQS